MDYSRNCITATIQKGCILGFTCLLLHLGVNSPRLLIFEKSKSHPKKLSLWPNTMPTVPQKSSENHAETLPNAAKSRPAAAFGRRRPTFASIWKSFGMVFRTFLRDFWHGFWPEAEFFWGTFSCFKNQKLRRIHNQRAPETVQIL